MASNTDSIDLTGHVAVVTGAGRGIGRAIAQRLAAAGASVALIARSPDELAQTAALIGEQRGRARPFPADITDANLVCLALTDVERYLGPVDLLVNNAGVLGPIAPFWETEPDDWWRVMDVNVRGQILCARRVLPGMIARRRGRIVNVTSAVGVKTFAFFTAYSTSKAALVRFTDCLAAETKPYGVAVFAIEPGSVRTAMTDYSRYSEAGRNWIPWYRRIFDDGRDTPPERVAERVLVLASGRADALSGRFLPIDEDIEILLKNAGEIETQNLYSLGIKRV